MIIDINIWGDSILSTSRDNTVKQWNVGNKKWQTFQGHGNWTTKAVHWEGGYASASVDKTLRIWSNDECKILRGHSSAINCLENINQVTVVSGSMDSTVKIWNLQRARLMANFTEHTSGIRCIKVQFPYLFTASQPENALHIRDLHTGSILQSIASSTEVDRQRANSSSAGEIHSIQFRDNMLYTGGNRCVRIFDLRKRLIPDIELEVPRPVRPQTCQPVLRSYNSMPPDIGTMEKSLVREELKLTDRIRRKVIKIPSTDARQVINLHIANDSLLIAGVTGLSGNVPFDLRQREIMGIRKDHDYPIVAMAGGNFLIPDIYGTAGIAKNYQYDLSVYHSDNPMTPITRYVPGHRAVITHMKIADDKIVTGDKKGQVRVLSFRKSAEQLRNENPSMKLLTHHD